MEAQCMGKTILIIILIIYSILITCHVVYHSVDRLWATEDITIEEDVDFYTGKSSKLCYPEGNIPDTIKKPPIFFETLPQCEEFIKRNK